MGIINGFEELKELMHQAQATGPTESQLQRRVKKIFEQSLSAVKSHYRPTLRVGKSFLENYYREKGEEKMRAMLSKISLLVDADGLDYLVGIGIIKKTNGKQEIGVYSTDAKKPA